MARIKPQALLNQSKKKKGPSRISISTIIVCNLVVAVVILSLVTTYRHWSQRSKNTIEQESQSHKFEDTNAASELKNYDLPGYADISTSKGLITVELFKDGSPEAVDKFLDLCQKDHFKGMPFHRVIKNYLVQAGHSPSSIPVEEWTAKGKLRGRLQTSPKHEAFMLGTPKTKGNNKDFELLITTAPIPDLNDQLIVFGRVLKGEDVVQEIEEVDTDEHQSPESLSSPESLLAHMKTSCKKQGVVVSGQNSSVPVPGGFERIVENLKDESVGIDLFTYQRMGALFFSPEHFHSFTVFVRNMNQVELSSYDQAVEDEVQTVNVSSDTGASSLQTA